MKFLFLIFVAIGIAATVYLFSSFLSKIKNKRKFNRKPLVISLTVLVRHNGWTLKAFLDFFTGAWAARK